MLRRMLIVVLAAALLAACNSSAKQGSKTEAVETAQPAGLSGKTFGAAVRTEAIISSVRVERQNLWGCCPDGSHH